MLGKTTVGEILSDLNYSLKSSSKKIAYGGRGASPQKRATRNNQFTHINKMIEKFRDNGNPVLSLDGKKKELIGNFSRPGRKYLKDCELTNDHDFLAYGLGKAMPYGIYDLNLNEGYIFIAQAEYCQKLRKLLSHDTPELAVDNLMRYWQLYGLSRYKKSTELLILADGGGSNSCTSRVWKYNIYSKFCKEYGISVSVCHYPPGASKWNPIEHKLFSYYSKNMTGVTLKTFEHPVKFARTTKTCTGLKVFSRLVTKKYLVGVKVDDKDFKSIEICKSDLNPQWNYTIAHDS